MATRKATSKKSPVQSPKKPTTRLPKLQPGNIPVGGKRRPNASNTRSASPTMVPRRRTHTLIEQQQREQEAWILAEIARLIQERTNEQTISFRSRALQQQLDAIADRPTPTAAQVSLMGLDVYLDDMGSCISNVLPSIDWWRRLAAQLVELCKYGGRNAYPSPEVERERMIMLLNNVLTAYADAENESSSYSCTGGEATLNLLRNYRLYTRDICDLAQHHWPMIDTAPLREFI